MLKSCPEPVDVQDLQFKLHCRLKVFNNKELDTFPKSTSLISCASRYGLLFVGSNSSNLQVVQIKCFEDYSPKDKEISTYPRRTINLPSPPKHICVNCDSTILAVVIEKDKCPCVIFYDVLSFLKQNVVVVKEVRLSPTPGVYVNEINWNPALPPIFTACKSDGTLGVYEIKGTSIDINELPSAAEATAFCWSPKGKQIAVGSKNGKITQYKPDLKAVKVINEPPLGAPHSLISLQWVSNYQFIGVYQPANPENSPKCIVVDAPKSGETSYTNYEDICYSGATRLPQFYMILQQHWNILMVASSNSTELGVLACTNDTWTQLILPDSARAELPLSSDHQETFPIGLALDISPTKPLPWNESSIPPCPYLLLLSHQGIICIFNVVNLKQGIPSICTPPDPISDLSGINQFVSVSNIIQVPELQKTETPKVPLSGFSIPVTQNAPATQASLFGSKILSQPQPTYGSPGSLVGAKPPESKPLFGGQAVLTPIKPQLPTTQAPLFGGTALIAPISKPQSSTPTSVPTNNKYSSIFSALNAPAPTVPVAQTKPIVISTAPAVKTEQPVGVEQPVVQPKVSIPTVKPTESNTSIIDAKIKVETDALLAQMVRDECISLESELKALLHQGRSLNTNIGTEAEKLQIVSKIDALQEFIKEIVDISIGENAEVHYLKQNLIQSWAWFEEARSRYNSSKDEAISLLVRSQPLDSATEKRQEDIRKLMYYIESQITQASKALDEQWDNFQDYAKKTHRTQMPTMETIFQAMVRQNAILSKQSYILKDIASRLKHKGRSTYGPPLVSIENVKDLEDNLKQLQIQQPQDIYQMQYERVVNRMKNLSASKTSKLRNLLKNRETVHVTVVKPQLSSSLMLQSPAGKSKQLLSHLLTLSSQMSPVSKTGAIPKNLFVHSTPIRDTRSDVKPINTPPMPMYELPDEIKPTETPPNTPQIDAKIFTFKNFEKAASASTTTVSSFVPLTKSISVFSNLPQMNTSQGTLTTHTHSAFVPTTQVTLGTTNKPFTFSPAATTAVPLPKTVTQIETVATSIPAAVSVSSGFPKFNVAVVPKTTSSSVSAAAPVKTSTPTIKTTLPQFNFGGSITITPVSASKKEESGAPITSAISFGTVTSPKSTFSFGNANTFGQNTKSTNESVTTSKTDAPSSVTSTRPLFSNLLLTNKPLFGNVTTSSTSSGTFTFGAVSSSSKPSAFSAVTTTATPSITPSTTTPSSKTTSTSNEPTVESSTLTTTPSVFGTSSTADSSFKAPTAIFGNVTSTSSAPSTTTSQPVSIFGAAAVSSKPQSIFGNTSTPTTSAIHLPTATTSSIFANLTAVTKPVSIFNVTSSTTTASSTSVFPSVTTSSVKSTAFSVPTTAVASTTSGGSIFASNVAPATTKPSIFGNTVTATTASGISIFTSTPVVSTTKLSIFGSTMSTTTTTASNAPNLFSGGTQSATTTVGATTTTQTTSIFTSSTTVAATKPPILGAAAVSSTQSTVFDSPSTPVTTQTSIFGGTTTTQSSVFGGPITSTTATKTSVFGAVSGPTQPSIFGASIAATTQQGSIFGTNTSTSQPSIFGTSSGIATTQKSIFGATTAVSTSKPSIFGATTTDASTQPSLFAAATTTPSTQTSIFGAPSTTSSPFGSIFGSAPTSTSSSAFGQSGSIFDSSKTASSPFGTTFGSPPAFGSTPTTTASVFGQPAFGATPAPVFGTPTTSTNMFGGNTGGSTFGTVSSSANVFGSPAVSSSSFSFAGAAGNTSSSGTFGFGGLNVGNTATTSNSIFGGSTPFGQTPAATVNPFGGTTPQKSPFEGSSSGSMFGNPASTPNSVFGGNTGSIFGSNTQTAFGTSTFGSPSTFGQQSAFGQSTFGNTSFGSSQPGPFSSGTAVGQSGFGSPPSFQKPSSFGSSPVFGGSPQPAFGAAPSFGGVPAFGAAPTFGSPNKVFGSTTPTAGFGAAASGSTGFGNLANQNTVGFGSLAQQASTQSSTPFSGSSSFSSWR